MPIYEATQNSDQTEGRGHQVPIGYFDRLEDAVDRVKGKGVMGVGDGEVYELTIHYSVPDLNAHGRETKKMIYGYRKDLKGKWGYGYVDNRDAPPYKLEDDPDYKVYLILKNKFESQA